MLLPLLLTLGAPAGIDLYIGTYTSKEGSQGIYHARLDPKTGEISEPELAVEAANPSYLALHPKGRFLYAVHEWGGAGDASAYAVGADAKLTLLNTRGWEAGGPCHASVDAAGKHLLVAGYGSGRVSSIPIGADGRLGEAATVFQNEGSGPDKARQEHPHAHSVHADAGSHFAYACDLGTDEVVVFRLDDKSGTLTKTGATKVRPGSGPRHFAWGKGGGFAYVNNEMANTVTAFTVNRTKGLLTELQSISTLPQGVAAGKSHSAQIVVHPNGKWLYVSNRGHDSMAVFRIVKGGRLELVEVEPAEVREPRGFEIDPTGGWLVVAGQNSNDLVARAIDPKTGRLKPGGKHVSVPKPVCVVFKR